MPLQYIQTERLCLVPLTSSEKHLTDFHRIWSNEDATKWSPTRRCATLEASKSWMSGLLPTAENPHPIGYGAYILQSAYGIAGKEEEPMVGLVTLLPRFSTADRTKKPDCYELGYNFHPEAWGKGYATESVKALCSNHRSSKVLVEVDERNTESRRVIEKSGFEYTSDAMNDGNRTLRFDLK